MTDKILNKLLIEKEHRGSAEQIAKYVEENRIQELFNVSQAC